MTNCIVRTILSLKRHTVHDKLRKIQFRLFAMSSSYISSFGQFRLLWNELLKMPLTRSRTCTCETCRIHEVSIAQYTTVIPDLYFSHILHGYFYMCPTFLEHRVSTSVSVRSAMFATRAAAVFSSVSTSLRTFFHPDLTKTYSSRHFMTPVTRYSSHQNIYVARFFCNCCASLGDGG